MRGHLYETIAFPWVALKGIGGSGGVEIGAGIA